MADALSNARSLLEARLRELDDEKRQVESALASLGGKQTRSAGSVKRAGHGKRQTQFLAAVGKHPKRRPADIARQMGVPPSQIHALARKLLKDGKIVKSSPGYTLKN